ncbi:MAG TPA: lipopolysaccharide heptosyltransferase II [Verrucomicrobiae bacterium]|nr:lipopolysaccharide heptosyltransferase II [Verrucomicrobiae bacterium]
MITLPSRPRILVTRADRIGDLVVSTPVFAALREKFPDAWIAALVFAENRELVEGHPALDEVILYDKKGSEKGWLGNFAFSRRLAAKHFDAVIHLHSTNRMHWAGYLAGIPVRIGWDRKCSWALTHPRKDVKSEGKKHEALYNFELLEDFGIWPPQELETHFTLSPKARRSVEELFFQLGIPADKPLLVLHPTASCPSKMWPASRFAELADLAARKYGATIVLVGSDKDRQVSAEIAAACSASVCDLGGRLSLSMLGVLLRESAALVSNDTGPVHIASAVGTPVVSIFGRNQPGLSPARWKPLGKNARVVWRDVGCHPCLAHDCRINFLCLDVISVSDVLRELESLGSVWQKIPFASDIEEVPAKTGERP